MWAHPVVSFASLLLGVGSVLAAPATSHVRRGVTVLSQSQVTAFDPYTEFARATYCGVTQSWNCGASCDANPHFVVSTVGGDGNDIQDYFTGYDPSLNSVIVAHEGTDPTKFLSVLTDASFVPIGLNDTLFPNVPSDVMAHSGFLAEHAKTAGVVLSQVKALTAQYNTKKVTLVGHSLGGALAELDQLFLNQNLGSGYTLKAVTFGTPRVGNQAFADFFDAQNLDFTRMNNKYDPVPILPGRFLGFVHPGGEVHVVPEFLSSEVVSCPGQDDATDADCTIQTVPNIAESDILDHLGPYNGIMVGTIFC